MAEYLHGAPSWMHHAGTSGTVTPSRLQSQLRSFSLTHAPHMANKHLTKSASTPHLKKRTPSAPAASDDMNDMNTIPDPRSLTPQPTVARKLSTDSDHHPDLSQEVATLSTKLINAINHQDTLDNALQRTRHELDATKEKMEAYEGRVWEHEALMKAGLLVEREVYVKMEKEYLSELQEEKRRRNEAEKAKRRVDSEIETLTAALFEEANLMVSEARKETEAAEKRTEQARHQLADAELLQMSLQEQLHDLKGVMEKMSERDDMESNTLPTTTAPSTPGITPADKMSKLFESVNLTPNTPGSEEIAPEHPLHFHHLIRPVLRNDLPSFNDFQEMLQIPIRSAPSSRASSGNYGGLNVLGLGSLTNHSTTSLPVTTRPPSSVGTNSPRDSITSTSIPNLKDEKFYKRAVAEDIEPTLRLDIAPGLSWMARRTVLNSISAGSLVVEPSPPPSKFRGPVFPCSLCGEARKGELYARKFRFKSSETDETKHPLCDWCLGRLRATCDYIGFLRMIAAGHWRAETEQEKKSTWEESVRLRERMFWMRIGGGVVPAWIPMREGPQTPAFADGKHGGRTSEESQMNEHQPLDLDAERERNTARKSEDDPFQTKQGDPVKRVSIGKTIIEHDASSKRASMASQATTPSLEEEQFEEAKEEQAQPTDLEVRRARKSELLRPSELKRTRSASQPAEPVAVAQRRKDERLSLTIPGAFE